MSQLQLNAPPSVTQNIARAKSYVKRDELIRALDCLLSALELFQPDTIIGKARYVVEVNILECVADLNSHAKIRSLLQSVAKSANVSIAYTPGEEAKLAPVLQILRKALMETEAAKLRAAEEAVSNRKEALFAKARQHLAEGETPRGKAVLRQVGDEFGGEPGVLADIGKILIGKGLQWEAIEFLEQAVENFPRSSGPYADLVACYLEMREYEKAEKLYLKVIKEFGEHPKTLVNLGKMYISWNKKDKAFDVLNKAVRKDPGNEEARALYAKLGG